MRQKIACEKAEIGAEARKKAETETEAPNSRELVVHSVEWTTSSLRKGGNQGKSPEKARASGPLFGVDH